MMATLSIQICPQSYESRPLSDLPSSPLILQLETEARTKWHNFDNNMRLSDRAQDIERWQRELEKTLREVDAEAATLQERKNAKHSKKNLFHENDSSSTLAIGYDEDKEELAFLSRELTNEAIAFPNIYV